MLIQRGGYVNINLSDIKFNYSVAFSGMEWSTLTDELYNLFEYAVKTQKPVCITNAEYEDENGIQSYPVTFSGVKIQSNYYDSTIGEYIDTVYIIGNFIISPINKSITIKI